MTPVGWGSVAYSDAQVSFPPSFEIITPQPGGINLVMVDASSAASGGVCLGPC